MNGIDTEIARVMKIDPLEAAERLTGQVVEDGGIGFAAGLAMIHGKASAMERLLTARGDVWDGMPLAEYRAIVETYGFELVHEIAFEADGRSEACLFYAHHDGLLLRFDTYNGDHVNSGNVYYCWRKRADTDDTWLLSSGRWIGPDYSVFAGHHDCREALLFKMDRLRAAGEFVSPWPERPFLWLLHYGDTRTEGCDCNAINSERIAILPEWVREFIGA